MLLGERIEDIEVCKNLLRGYLLFQSSLFFINTIFLNLPNRLFKREQFKCPHCGEQTGMSRIVGYYRPLRAGARQAGGLRKVNYSV